MEKAIEITTLSTEIIKPSKPTPPHLTTFNLSLLDQLITKPYAPVIIFFPPNDAVSAPAKLRSLKSSLSETLARYYPLAGKISPSELSIECNDQGARFVEAKVDSSFQRFFAQPGLIPLLNGLLPCELGFGVYSTENEASGYLTNVQASVFNCGGVAIGLCVSHKLLDGAALSAFLQSWFATSRDDRDAAMLSPCLDTANTLFPAEDAWLQDISMVAFDPYLARGKCITKRFLFDASAISSLKAKATKSSSGITPTRVESVSAFLWQCVVATSQDTKGKYALSTHIVNLRRRTTPFLSERSVGNLLWMVPAKCDATGALPEFASSLRRSFSKIDACFVETLRGDGEGNYEAMLECVAEIGELGKECSADMAFSSWCKFGFYEVDFGWGRPAWVSCVGLYGSEVFMRLVMLLDTRLGDGIEAWLSLDERDMASVERDSELLQYAKVNPTPC